jgi:hypothetical protein
MAPRKHIAKRPAAAKKGRDYKLPGRCEFCASVRAVVKAVFRVR